MERITKREFKDLITSRKSIFVGIAKEITEQNIAIAEGSAYKGNANVRTAVARSNAHIVFSNDSHLTLTNNDNTVIKCYREGNVVVVENTYTDVWCGVTEVTRKCMFYRLCPEITEGMAREFYRDLCGTVYGNANRTQGGTMNEALIADHMGISIERATEMCKAMVFYGITERQGGKYVI